MASPAEYYTPDRIIRSAMTEAGLLQEGSDPSSGQYSNYLDRLNDVVNICLKKPGLKLWTFSDQPMPLTQGKGSYVIGPTGDVSMPKPDKVEEAYYADNTGQRRPLFPIAWADWTKLGTVTQQGAVTQYLVDKQVNSLFIRLWPVPDSAAALGSVHFILKNQLVNFTGIADTMMFPQEWFMYLRWALADDICTGQPEAIMARCSNKAEYYYNMLSDADVEDAPLRFEPDSRVGVEGNFS